MSCDQIRFHLDTPRWKAKTKVRGSNPTKGLFEGRMGLIGLMGPMGAINDNEEFTDDEGAHRWRRSATSTKGSNTTKGSTLMKPREVKL